VRIARAGYAFGYVDRPVYQYRVVQGSVSRNHALQAQSEFARLDKFFGDDALPPEVEALQPQAYAALHFEFAAKFYQAGEMVLGRQHMREAVSTSPTLTAHTEWLLEWVAGFALGPEVEDPHQMIDLIWSNLPSEATMLCGLRRRAHGRYHVAAAFAAHQGEDPAEIRRHILPALVGDPSVVSSRGFWSIAFRSLFA
jgi:hypothetical protein